MSNPHGCATTTSGPSAKSTSRPPASSINSGIQYPAAINGSSHSTAATLGRVSPRYGTSRAFNSPTKAAPRSATPHATAMRSMSFHTSARQYGSHDTI